MTIRWHLVRILVGREMLRLRKNPAAIMLLGLLLALALLISASTPPPRPTGPATCWIVYWEYDPLVELLRKRLPSNLSIKIASRDDFPLNADRPVYPPGDHAIELRPQVLDADGNPHPQIAFLYSGDTEQILFPYTQWFWSITAEHLGDLAPLQIVSQPLQTTRKPRGLESTSLTDLLTPEMTASLLLFAVQFFICCHLFVSFTSQDRERGTLNALALTPAHPVEILYAKYIFHLILSLAASAAMIAILKPSSIGQPLLWGSIGLTSLGLLSVGTLICALCRTQSAAGLLMLCYLLGMGVVFVLGTRYTMVGSLRLMMFETHSMSLTYMSLKFGNRLILMTPLFW
ncbi:MAG: ABC transporter permease, partial [Planctomycetaceae bacterium]